MSASPDGHSLGTEVLEQYYGLMSTSPTAAAAVIAEALQLGAYKSDTRQSVRVGLAMQVLNFAHDLHFTHGKANSILNLSYTLLQMVVDRQSLEASKQGE